jgi:hypothetical protein
MKREGRRQLTKSQQSAIGAEAQPLFADEAKQRQREHGGTSPGKGKQTLPKVSAEVIPSDFPNDLKGDSRDLAAKAVGVSGYMVGRATSGPAGSEGGRAPRLLTEMKTSGQRRASSQGRPIKASNGATLSGPSSHGTTTATLEDLGVTRDQSSQWQQLGTISKFDKLSHLMPHCWDIAMSPNRRNIPRPIRAPMIAAF